MARVTWFLVILTLTCPSMTLGATDAEKCEAAKEKAAGKYAACRLTAESKFTTSGDAAKRGAAVAKCGLKLVRSFDQAETKYDVDCPTIDDIPTVEDFLGVTSDQLVAYLASGSPEPGSGFCGPQTAYDSGTKSCLPTCGNGDIDPDEECDFGDLDGASCASLGLVDGVLRCGPGCILDTSDCLTCGNGVVDPGEECDGGDLGSETCSSQGQGDGTLTCLPSCTFDTSVCTGTNEGSCGILFDQTSFDTVGFPDDPSWDVGSSGVTVEFWFNPLNFTLGPGSHILFEAFVTKYKVSIEGGTTLNFVTTSLSPPNDAFAPFAFPANAWTHIATVWDGTEKRVYVNGEQLGQTSASGSITGVVGANLSHGSHPVLGVIDELRVSSVARYDSDFLPGSRFLPDGNTVGLWHFDECAGISGDDSGPNGIDAVIPVTREWYGDSQP